MRLFLTCGFPLPFQGDRELSESIPGAALEDELAPG